MVGTESGPRLLHDWLAEKLARRLNVDVRQLPPALHAERCRVLVPRDARPARRGLRAPAQHPEGCHLRTPAGAAPPGFDPRVQPLRDDHFRSAARGGDQPRALPGRRRHGAMRTPCQSSSARHRCSSPCPARLAGPSPSAKSMSKPWLKSEAVHESLVGLDPGNTIWLNNLAASRSSITDAEWALGHFPAPCASRSALSKPWRRPRWAAPGCACRRCAT